METKENTVENPNTAIGSENAKKTQSTSSSSKHKHKVKSKFIPNFEIPGVHIIILTEDTQSDIGCVAGDNVTAEKPWINIDKELIQENIDRHPQTSEFLPLKQKILEFPGTEILIGYIPDESKSEDEFYICVTEQATKEVKEIVEKLQRIQDKQLENAINKKIKRWKSLGSEKEVSECIVKYNRSLMEVEIETKYPILPFKLQFRLVKVEDLLDSYMCLVPSEDKPAVISKLRVDASVQVTPSKISSGAQTICTYPKNSFTQYEYDIPMDTDPSQQCVQVFKDYVTENIECFCDILQVNGTIDLYVNDYENLVQDPKFSYKIAMPSSKDYLCFIDMNICGGKMISSFCWHPMWTGCAILSYVDIAPPLYLQTRVITDEVLKSVHDTNPVLFWSFEDDLKPKLILETPRPVFEVSCCPFNENLVIGGCVNGQIIIWDITNKLHGVEQEIILNIKQEKYKGVMYSMMNWMKNIFDLTLVRPAAISDLKHSHRSCVNNITWMSPFHKVTVTGKLHELEETENHSLQIMTSSEDGTILIWDLLKKPISFHSGFHSARTMKRLKKRPSALVIDESPYKKLHLNLKPIYKINLSYSVPKSLPLNISSFLGRFFKTTYTVVTEESKNLQNRLIYKPILERYNSDPNQSFFVGTMEGDFIQAAWDGQEFDSGEAVNFETGRFVTSGKYHDGPVVSIDYAPVTNTFLTVGGRVFALWREDFPNRPILWRTTKSIYTQGSWFGFDNSSLKLIRVDGCLETWTLFHKSKSALTIDLTTNGAVTFMDTHPRKLVENVYGLCDYRGSLRLFYMHHQSPLVVEAKEKNMSEFLTSEIERKKLFLQWQEEWNKRHVPQIKSDPSAEKQNLLTEMSRRSRREIKHKEEKVSPGLKYVEMIKAQYKQQSEERVKTVILERKQLKTDELLKQREPLDKLEQESRVRIRKQKNKLKQADYIFKHTVEMWFPDVIKAKSALPPSPYEDNYTREIKKEAFSNFQNISIEAQKFVDDNPCSLQFDWKNIVKEGRERRKLLNHTSSTHKERFSIYKKQRLNERLDVPSASVSGGNVRRSTKGSSGEKVRE